MVAREFSLVPSVSGFREKIAVVKNGRRMNEILYGIGLQFKSGPTWSTATIREDDAFYGITVKKQRKHLLPSSSAQLPQESMEERSPCWLVVEKWVYVCIAGRKCTGFGFSYRSKL